ncbi:MAG: DUF5615 family PIN-like protein [bacterium]|nr:DUF5615 family PIN-like protein [bacterium]
MLDANISPLTAIFLRSFGFVDVKSLIEDGLGGIDDSEVAKIAECERRILITFDLDFGEMYYFALKKKFGVIVLRLDDQRVEMVNAVLKRFFETGRPILKRRGKKLIIITEAEIRIIE